MRYCKSCAKEIPDGAATCPHCGAAAEGAPEAKKKPFPLKAVIIGLAGLIVVLAAVLVLTMTLGKGYEKPLDTLAKTFNSGKLDEAALQKAAGAVVGSTGKQPVDDAISAALAARLADGQTAGDFLQEQLDNELQELRDTYGEDAALSYSVLQKDRLTDDQLKSYQLLYRSVGKMAGQADAYFAEQPETLEQLSQGLVSADNADRIRADLSELGEAMQDAKVTDGYLLKLELKLSGEKSADTRELDVAVVKLDGKWVISLPEETLGKVNAGLTMLSFESLLQYLT